MSNPGSELNTVANAVANAIPTLVTILSVLAPEAAPAATVAGNIVRGLIAGLPEAESLWAQIKSGTVPTQAELEAYEAAELSAYDTVMGDIATAMTPPTAG